MNTSAFIIWKATVVKSKQACLPTYFWRVMGMGQKCYPRVSDGQVLYIITANLGIISEPVTYL